MRCDDISLDSNTTIEVVLTGKKRVEWLEGSLDINVIKCDIRCTKASSLIRYY